MRRRRVPYQLIVGSADRGSRWRRRSCGEAGARAGLLWICAVVRALLHYVMDGSALAGVDSMVSMRGEGMVSGQSNGVPVSDGGSASESSSTTAISGGTNGNNQVECHNGGAARNGESQWSLVASDGSKMNKIQEIVENHTR